MISRKRGTREVRLNGPIDELMCTAGAGQRTDILRALVSGPKHVSALAEELFLKAYAVSRDLGALEMNGLVACGRSKNFHHYSLTDRVRAFQQDSNLQLVMVAADSNWVLVNIAESPDPRDAIAPPCTFVNPIELSRRCCE